MTLDLVPGSFAVCRLAAAEAQPPWATIGAFSSITRTPAELSIVCDASSVPPGVRAEGPFRAVVVRGPLDFSLTRVLASLAGPLAAAGVGIVAIATFDTDYLFVREHDLARAASALRGAGHALAFE